MKPSQIITTDLIADLMSDDLEEMDELPRSMFITAIKKVIEKEAEVYASAEPDGSNKPDRITRCVVIVEKVWEVMNAFIHSVDSLGGSTDDDEPTISKAVAANAATSEKFELSQSVIDEFKKALKEK